MKINEIRDNFALLDDWDDRYRYVIELGRTLTPRAVVVASAHWTTDEPTVSHATRIACKQVCSDNLLIIPRRVREGTATVDVTDCKYAGHVCLELIVDDDVSACVGGNACHVQTQIGCVW